MTELGKEIVRTGALRPWLLFQLPGNLLHLVLIPQGWLGLATQKHAEFRTCQLDRGWGTTFQLCRWLPVLQQRGGWTGSSLRALAFPRSLINNSLVCGAYANRAVSQSACYESRPWDWCLCSHPALLLLNRVNALLCFRFFIGKVGTISHRTVIMT